jgi:hypothetical protein
MNLVRADGSVRIHTSLLDPTRLLMGGMERMRALILGAALVLGEFTCFYAMVITVDTMFWVVVAIVWLICCVVYGAFLRRLGSRGGYFHSMYARRVREQAAYRRSAHPTAPISKIPDHAEA